MNHFQHTLLMLITPTRYVRIVKMMMKKLFSNNSIDDKFKKTQKFVIKRFQSSHKVHYKRVELFHCEFDLS